jgi:hypothetical protein
MTEAAVGGFLAQLVFPFGLMVGCVPLCSAQSSDAVKLEKHSSQKASVMLMPW